MTAEKLYLKNFRNCIDGLIEFDKNVNILIGDNAQGKTNILEALYIFAYQKSFRGAKNKDMIAWNKDFLELVLEFELQGHKNRALIRVFSNKNKENFLNGVRHKKAAQMVGLFNAVLFAPEHLNLIKDGPAERRKFIDLALCQIDKVYFYALIEYKKILEQKNFYLKNEKNKIDEILLDVWNQKICQSAFVIQKKREEFIKDVSYIAKKNHFEISTDKEELDLIYKPSMNIINLSKETIYESLKKNTKRDILAQSSILGVHRDDIEFLINKRPAKDFASQGQQRSAVLSLKLAECEIFKNISGHYPMLLLDDIMSELDKSRQNYIINKIQNIQVLITCCSRENIEGFENGKIFFVKDGHIITQ